MRSLSRLNWFKGRSLAVITLLSLGFYSWDVTECSTNELDLGSHGCYHPISQSLFCIYSWCLNNYLIAPYRVHFSMKEKDDKRKKERK